MVQADDQWDPARGVTAFLENVEAIQGKDTLAPSLEVGAEVSCLWISGNGGRSLMPGQVIYLAGQQTMVQRIESDLSGTKLVIRPVITLTLSRPNQHQFSP